MRLVLVLILCLPLVGYADQLTTIYDSGDTVSIDRYARRTPRADTAESFDQRQRPAFPVAFPITTPSMRPGKINPTAFSLPHLQTPLFLIGSDDFSRQWLLQRRDELKALGAVGLLVDADSRETVKAMVGMAKGLRLIPASATAISQSLGLQHYPVLIFKTGWEQ